MTKQEDIAGLFRKITRARHCAALTGAGVSTLYNSGSCSETEVSEQL
jgi:hypothetical protein